MPRQRQIHGLLRDLGNCLQVIGCPEPLPHIAFVHLPGQAKTLDSIERTGYKPLAPFPSPFKDPGVGN